MGGMSTQRKTDLVIINGTVTGRSYLRDIIDPIIISPNEVFGDIMVLASPPRPRQLRPRPPPRPPVDPDDVNTLT